jgi:hypothetical protein
LPEAFEPLIIRSVETSQLIIVRSIAETWRDRLLLVMIPFDRMVTRVDREARVIRIDPPEGLLDLS